jgi:hypothetical protein
MKKIASLILKNKDLIIVFFLSLFFSAEYFIEICKGYLSYGKLDLEYFLLWDYSFIKHLIPFRDLIYPYGLLQFFRNGNLFTLFVYYAMPSISLVFFYFLFKKIFAQKYYLFVSTLALFIFILSLPGFAIFGRYGLSVGLSLLFAYLWYKHPLKKILFFIGLGLGMFFSIISDQGTYLITTLALFIPIYYLIKGKVKRLFSINFYLELLKTYLALGVGLVLGIIPLIIYLYLNNMFLQFINYFSDLNRIIIVSKGPFFNYVTSPDNLFTLLIIFLALSYLLLKRLFYSSKINVAFYAILILLLDILVLEQKSLVRSIDKTITFVPFVIFLILLYEFLQFTKMYRKEIVQKLFYLLFILIAIFSLGLRQSYQINFNPMAIYNSFRLGINNRCFDDNLNVFLRSNPVYTQIQNSLKKENLANKSFSFPPGDSVSYILLNQMPPYYSSVYSDASVKNQTGDIAYIKRNKIQIAQLDTIGKDNYEDGVPLYIREATIFKYILSNYYPLRALENHLILLKDQSNDFFDSPILNGLNSYRNYLLNINLGMIPFSEGIYKYKYFINKPLLNVNSVDAINGFLKKQKVLSENKVFVLIPNKDSVRGSQNSLHLTTIDNKETTIYFNSCKANKPCVINLSNIPLFYKDRQITNIATDDSFKGSIEIFSGIPKNLW